MNKNQDIVIVGGGVIGCSIAYFLSARTDYRGEILVVERDRALARGATGRSWGGIRQQFSLPENLQISLFAMEFLRNSKELLDLPNGPADLSFREQGYLFLANPRQFPALCDLALRQRSWGAQELLSLDQTALRERFAWLNTSDLAGGVFGPVNEGWIDPNSLRQAFREKARQQGVRFIFDEVVALDHDDEGITSLTLQEEGVLSCGILINAAGPWAGELAAMADCHLPVAPRKRMTYLFDCREDLQHLPLTIDPTGVAFRPESGKYMAIMSPPEDQDRDGEDHEADYSLFEEIIWPTLANRVPAFEAIKLVNAWAGQYDYNRFDQNAVIGPHPQLHNFYFCNGFSGHGLQQAPAMGRAMAELILDGGYQSLDLGNFRYERILEGRPYAEEMIV